MMDIRRVLPSIAGMIALAAAAGAAQRAKPPAEFIPGSGSPTPFMPERQIKWEETVDAPGYVEAAAHAPKYDPKRWPGLTGDEPFFTREWPAGRLYVWATPGEGSLGGRRGREVVKNIADPKCWLDADGKHPDEITFDEKTDLVFPPSENPYTVTFAHRKVPGPRLIARHITVGRNAVLGGGTALVHGNIWVKHGGHMGVTTLRTGGKGARFIRNDHLRYGDRIYGRDIPKVSGLSHYAHFGGEGPLWMLGANRTNDEFTIRTEFIVGPDSIVQPGRNAWPKIFEGAKLVLLDGAYFGNWSSTVGRPDLECEGVIQGGLPDKPLKRKAMLGLHFKNYSGKLHPEHAKNPDMSTPYSGSPEKASQPVPTLILKPGSSILAYTTDPQNAPLLIGWTGFSPSTNIFGRNPNVPVETWYHQIPRRIKIAFGKGVTVENVTFDYVLKGGLIVESRTDFEQWRNVRFGEHCDGKAEALVTTRPN